MLSVVSDSQTPVLPFIIQSVGCATDAFARRMLGACEGFDAPRFFTSEPAESVRLTVALTTAVMAQAHDHEAVVVLAPASRMHALGTRVREALERAARLARTGKVVELVAADSTVGVRRFAEIRGMAGCLHLGEPREGDYPGVEGTGIFVLRADSFLVEAEILCGEALAACRDALLKGRLGSGLSALALDQLARLSFSEGYWSRTDNRAAVVIGERYAATPVGVPSDAPAIAASCSACGGAEDRCRAHA